jgi:hypothetical protein
MRARSGVVLDIETALARKREREDTQRAVHLAVHRIRRSLRWKRRLKFVGVAVLGVVCAVGAIAVALAIAEWLG